MPEPQNGEGKREGEAAVEVRGLVKEYPLLPEKALAAFLFPWKRGWLRALDGVSLEVRRGSVFGILGTNGAGKTTLLKILYGLLLPTAGSVEVLGLDPAREGKKLRSRAGMVTGDERSFYWRLTLRQNLQFFASLHGLDPRSAAARIERTAVLLGLENLLSMPFSDLSSGMRQRAAVARALLHDPELLIMDEPTRSLSPETALPLQNFFRTELVEKGGKTLVVATQNMDEARRLCDDVAVLHRGRILFMGTLPTLLEEGKKRLGRDAVLSDIFVDLVKEEETGAEGGEAGGGVK
jgi:ABC-2 type transport system ATP-binding protein